MVVGTVGPQPHTGGPQSHTVAHHADEGLHTVVHHTMVCRDTETCVVVVVVVVVGHHTVGLVVSDIIVCLDHVEEDREEMEVRWVDRKHSSEVSTLHKSTTLQVNLGY